MPTPRVDYTPLCHQNRSGLAPEMQDVPANAVGANNDNASAGIDLTETPGSSTSSSASRSPLEHASMNALVTSWC
jgi:hypothetical protein